MTATNRATVQRLFNDAINKHDLSVLWELCADDCTYHLPLVGELRGEALRQFVASLIAAFPDAQRTVEDLLSDDIHKVVTRWTFTGSHQGHFMGIAPTGKRVAFTGISIHTIHSGKLVEEWQEWDSLGLMQQLGVVPTFKFEATAA